MKVIITIVSKLVYFTYLGDLQTTVYIYLVGGWTNPLEKYAGQNGFIFPN